MANSLKFHLITDLHHYAEVFEFNREQSKGDQQCREETGAILDAAFDFIAKDKDTDILLIAGDITCNGEKESHIELLEKLHKLKGAGKKIYLITATHDYNENPGRVRKDTGGPATPTLRNELPAMYNDFGRGEALCVHEESFSYSVKLQDGYRLLCLNDDGNGRSFCGYYEDTMNWILNQIEDAKKAGDYIFAMTHHPMLPPSPIYPLFSKRDMLGDYEKTSEILADAGIEFVFTGHTHMQNIAVKTSANGNDIYDINTGSLVGYPSVIRKAELDDEKMDIKSLQISDIDWDMGGRTLNEYLYDNFKSLLDHIFYCMAYDIDHLSDMAGGFSVEKSVVQKFRLPLNIGGKVMQKLTLGGIGRLLFAGKKIDKSVKSLKLKDLVVELIMNLYNGDEPHVPGSPIYNAFDVFIKRVTPIIKLSKKSDNILGILLMVKDGMLYDAPPSDWNAILYRQKGRQEK